MKKLLLPLLLSFVVTSAIGQQKSTDISVQSIERNSIDNTPASIVFSDASTYKKGQGVELFQKYFGLDGVNNKVAITNTTVTKQHTTVERYEQYYKGIKVEQGVYTILYNRNEQARFMNGNLYSISYNPSTNAKVTEQTARARALATVNAKTYAWQMDAMEAQLKKETNDLTATYLPKGELVWIEDKTLPQPDRKLHLAYRFNIYATEPLSRENIYIDATTGKLLFRNSLIDHTNGSGASLYSGTVNFKTSILSGTNKLRDSTRGSGINTYSYANTTGSTVLDITSATTTWSTDAALDAHWGAEKVYDYWLNEQGRNSFNNSGAAINSYVHYSTNYNNAFWNGSQMTYGDGSGIAGGGFSPLTSIDVCAHEIGHAVCQYTANLAYNKESGAMNEGFSDIWGAIIEEYADPHETDAVAKSMWKIGEEIGTNPIRRMDNPNLRSQPDTYGGTYWVSVVGCTPSGANDYCGVHTNSGVLNYWFYLLCTGGSGTNDIGNAFSVTGIGTAEGADIAYQTELLLTSTSTYANCRTASISAATTLYGACSPQVEAVTRAWYAVGVGTNYTGGSLTAITGTASVCVGSTTTLANATSGGTWSSSNTSVATIGSTGIVTGVAAGTSNITYVVAGGCYATRVETVSITPTVSAISGASSVCTGNTITLSNSTSGGTWSSSSTSVATVGSSSGIVTGVAAGNATITYTVTNACGTVTATKNVTVNASPAAITGTTSVSVGSTTTLSSATSGGTWSSSNVAIATVGSGTGIVTGISAGNVTISYTVGGCTATKNVTVSAGPSKNITTIAGTGTAGYSGDGGPASMAQLNLPHGIDFDIAGNMYINDHTNSVIRMVNTSGIITTIAGTGTAGYGGDGGPATAAQLNQPFDVKTDASGNLYIGDGANNRVRKINSAGIITTIAGTGTAGYGGDGGPATAAVINRPGSVALDNSGNIYFTELNGHRVRKIDVATGNISTIAGDGTSGYAGDGGPSTGSRLSFPNFLYIDLADNIYITDNGNHRIRKIDVSGMITTVAGNGTSGYSGDGGAATAAKLYYPAGVQIDGAGNMYISDHANYRIRKVSSTGIISTYAGIGTLGYSGDCGPATAAQLNYPTGIVLGPDGNLNIVDRYNNRIRKIINSITISGTTSILIGGTSTLTGSVSGGIWSSSNTAIATVGSGTGVVTGISGGTVTISYTVGSCAATITVTVGCAASSIITTIIGTGASGNGSDGGAGTSTAVSMPWGVTTDPSGNIYVCDFNNNKVRKISPSGIVTTVAGTGVDGFSGDGGPATAAKLDHPTGLAMHGGNLYISDIYNFRIRKVNASGIITTVVGNGTPGFSGDGGPATAASIAYPNSLCLDPAGNIYIPDQSNFRIRKVNTSGIITTIAGDGVYGNTGDGGPATSARMKLPNGTAVDAAGNVYFSDFTDNKIRKINVATGIISTYAGTGAAGYSGDGGPATAATLRGESGLFFDNSGDMIITDVDNHVIRKITTSTGIITTIAGTGTAGYSGDGGDPLLATMNRPHRISIDASGNIYFSETENHVVRKIYSTATTISGSAALCAGGTSTLTATPTGGVWSSSNTSVATIGSSTGIVTAIAAGTSTISYNVSGGCGAAVVATVSAATAAVITGPSTVAVGGTITLSGSITGGSWSSSNTSIATVGTASGIVTGVSSGVVTISYTITNTCGTFVATTNITVGCGSSVTISTILGTGTAGNGGSGGAGTSTAVNQPWGICGDAAGNIYVCDFNNHKIRKVSPAGIVTIFAGTGIGGFTGDGGPATAAKLFYPTGLFMHGTDMYVSDLGNSRIRKIDASGIITTVAGNGTAGYGGDGGPATDASFNSVNGLCLDAAGNIYIPDQFNYRIRKVNTSGIISTIAGTGTYGPSGDGGPATDATLEKPNGVTVDATGNVFIADFDNNKIRKIDAATGIISTYAGTGGYGFSGDGGPATAATLKGGSEILFDNSGDMLLTDVDNHRIRKITTSTGIITTIAGIGTAGYSGDGGSPLLAQLNRPHRMIVDATGNIFFTEIASHVVRKITYGPTSTIGGTTAVCVGGTGTLTATLTGGTWSSGNTTVATIGASTGIWSGVSAGTAAITYSVSSGCDMAVIITVNPLPATITGAPTVCIGSTTALATTTTGGTWSSSNTAIATVGTDGVVTGVATGPFTVSYTIGTGCYRTKAMTVNPLPSPITGSLSVCIGATTVLSNSTGGGLSWTSSNPSVATIGSTSGLVTGISAGTTTITYTLTSGCTTTAEMTVNASGGTISGTLFICNGSSTTLSSSVTGGTWTSANTGIATVGSSTGIVNGLSAGVVNITYTLSGCTSIAAVTVGAMPSGITGTLNVCTGATTTLYSATSGGTWSSSDVSVATVGSTGIVTGILAGTSTISYVLSSGCMRTTTVTVTTGPDAITGTLTLCASSITTLTCTTPGGTWSSGSSAIATIGSTTGVLTGMLPGTSRISYTVGSCSSTVVATVSPALTSITGSSNVCVGLTTTFSHSVSGGTWTSSNTAVATVGSTTGIITGVTAGTATITYATTPSCYMTKPITVNGGAAAITGNTNVCLGSTSVLSCVTPGGTSWTSSNTGVATIGLTSGLVTGISLGTTNITYLASTGCTSTTVVSVIPLPSPITGTLTVCQGATTALSSAGTTGGTWVSSTLSKATVGSSSGIVTGVAGGSSTITYTWTNSCKVTALVSVTAFPTSGAIVGAGTMSVSATQTLTSSSPGGTWASSNAGVATIVAGTGFMTGISAGLVTISYTKTNTCGSTTSTRIFTITTSRPAPVSGSGDIVKFAAYPNPTDGVLTIESSVTGKLTIYTVDSREITQYVIKDAITSFTLPNDLASGIYMCRFSGDDGNTVMVRLIVEH